MLSELRVRTTGSEVERAWKAVDFSMTMPWRDGSTPIYKPDAHLWKPLKLLREQAKAERDKRLAAEVLNDDCKSLTLQTSNTDTGGILTDVFPADSTLTMLGAAEPAYDLVAQPDSLQFTGWPASDASPDTDSAAGDMQTMQYPMRVSNTQPTHIPNVTTSWADQSNGMATEMMNGSGTLINDSMNWSTWDDMVEQWGIQGDNQTYSNGLGPGFFGSGSNWF